MGQIFGVLSFEKIFVIQRMKVYLCSIKPDILRYWLKLVIKDSNKKPKKQLDPYVKKIPLSARGFELHRDQRQGA